ncbi:MFS transporter [Candidatus Peregrinibacteria bacterium]|nr:MFS transporter [Candidatus Peregrinibacteria bacterium]
MQKLQDAKLFYVHAALFAFSEIIFILSLPIYFYTQGFSLSFIFFFHAIVGFVGYIFTPLVISYIKRINIKFIFILGVLFYIAFGFSVFLINIQNYWWILALLFLSLQSVFYFPARHLFFVEIAHKKTVGLQTGVLNMVSLISRIIAPIVAGWIALAFPFSSVFLVGSVVMFLCIGPIFFIQTKIEVDFTRKEFFEMQKNHPVFRATRFAYFADGMNNIISYLLWPLFFFLFLANMDFFRVGSLMTITSLISAVIMVFVGHLFDKKYRKILLTASIFAQLVASFFRFLLLFFHPIVFVYTTQSLYSFSESALQSTFDSYLYSYGKVTDTALFTIHREINFSLGRFILCLLLAIITSFITKTEQLWFLFLLSIPILFLYSQKMKVDRFIDRR